MRACEVQTPCDPVTLSWDSAGADPEARACALAALRDRTGAELYIEVIPGAVTEKDYVFVHSDGTVTVVSDLTGNTGQCHNHRGRARRCTLETPTYFADCLAELDLSLIHI